MNPVTPSQVGAHNQVREDAAVISVKDSSD
jgi:hypothetical protein